MKLDPRGVEKAAAVLHSEWWHNKTPAEQFTAALTAYFDHLKAEGKMREAYGWRMAAENWCAETDEQQHEFPALIIKLED